jgi:hypothetical protein
VSLRAVGTGRADGPPGQGLSKPASARTCCPSLDSTYAHERVGGRPRSGRPESHQGVVVDRRGGLRERDAADLVAGGEHVRAVDQRRVDLPEHHLGQRRPDVLLERVRRRLDAGGLEDLGRRGAARDLRGAQRQLQLRPREVGEPADVAGVVGRYGDLEPVPDEDLRVGGGTRVGDRRMVAGLAAANTSAGAPATICWASPELAPKLSRTVCPG